jgi:hypothetical protein
VENPAVSWITGGIRLASMLACLIVAASFVLFATHQADYATSNQLADLGNQSALTATKADKPSSVRQTITDASDKLTSPFSNLLGFTKPWPVHIAQLLIALLLYGFAVGYAMRWVRMRL